MSFFPFLLIFFAIVSQSLTAVCDGDSPICRYITPKSLEHFPKRYVITGGPGVGKTTLIKHLQKMGFGVVCEAATDLIEQDLRAGISAPWAKRDFAERVALLQEARQKEIADMRSKGVFFDRSPVDAITYDIMANFEPAGEIVRILQEALDANFYNKTVFLIEDLGFCSQTEVRAETLEEAKKIERLLERNYRALGFEIVRIPACSVDERVEKIIAVTKNFITTQEQETPDPQ
ncbi:MAG: AAA family ATPase [Chlamydiota bacterium]